MGIQMMPEYPQAPEGGRDPDPDITLLQKPDQASC